MDRNSERERGESIYGGRDDERARGQRDRGQQGGSGDIQGGQSGGGAYPNQYSGMGGSGTGNFTGGQSEQGYYGGGQMGGRDFSGGQGGGRFNAGSTQERGYGETAQSTGGAYGGLSGYTGGGRDDGRLGSFREASGYGQSQGGPGQGGQQGRYDHDHDYRSWRDKQVSDFDRDYEEFRKHRQSKFHSEFDEWRKSRGGAGSAAGANAQTGGVIGGSEDEHSAPGISTDKKSDDMKK
jgi:hypothetical protein